MTHLPEFRVWIGCLACYNAGRLIAAPGDAKKEIRAAAGSSRFAYGPAIAFGSVLAALIG